MIFVTVGTHEQQFDRLIRKIDELKANHIIKDDIIIQTGFSTYIPKHCEWQKMFGYQQMIQLVKDARIVITHGGPSSFITSVQAGKIPVVVPRQKKFGEHVNDHQVDFCKTVEQRMGMIIVVDDIEEIESILLNYNTIVLNKSNDIKSNNTRFNANLEKLVEDLLAERN